MFNLQQYRTNNLSDILSRELSAIEIFRLANGIYKAEVGDQQISGNLLHIKENIKNAVEELKQHIWRLWDDLSDLADVISHSIHPNHGSLQNTIFLHSASRAYDLSLLFSQLRPVSQSLRNLFNVDISNVDDQLIEKFNLMYLRVRLIHYMILREIYRVKVIDCYLRNTKFAQISGPWANLDLPMKERVWEWDDEEEEYFSNRQKARREQIRYNPETDKYGFYFIWQDLTRDPYRFEDMKEDSPYKSRHLLTVP